MKNVKDLKVLVVDDEPELAELVAFEFEVVGCQVSQALSGREGLKALQAHPVDLIISDVRMANGDGVELLKGVRASHHAVPVVMFMTGFADLTLEEAYDMGAAAVFGKPFNRKELIKTVEKAIQPIAGRWSTNTGVPPKAVTIKRQYPSFEDAVAKNMFNIGHGGIFCSIEEIPSVSNAVIFDFTFSSGTINKFSGHGIVRWVRHKDDGKLKKGVGFEIVQLDDPSQADKIGQYLEKNMVKAFIPKM